MKKFIFAFKGVLLLFMLLTSCNNEEAIKSDNIIDLTVYQKLETEINEGLNNIAVDLRSEKTTFSDKNAVLLSAEKHFSNDPEKFIGFKKLFYVKSNYRIVENDQMNLFQKEEINKVIESVSNYENTNDFVSYLDERFDHYANDDININDKKVLLTFITAYKVSLIFFDNNQDLIQEGSTNNLRIQGFWKCFSGIIGGAVAGGIAGGELGLKIGTALGNPLKGAAIGGIIGGIGGAFGGGAAAC